MRALHNIVLARTTNILVCALASISSSIIKNLQSQTRFTLVTFIRLAKTSILSAKD